MDGLKERIQQLLQKKYLFPVSAVLLLMVVIVRIIQLNVAIDYTTGFFSKNSWSMPLLAVVMILFFVYAVWQTVHRKFQISYPYHEMNLKPAAIVCFALGGVMMLSGFAQIWDGLQTRATLKYWNCLPCFFVLPPEELFCITDI